MGIHPPILYAPHVSPRLHALPAHCVLSNDFLIPSPLSACFTKSHISRVHGASLAQPTSLKIWNIS
jgi:hypothetical protein